MSRTLDSTIIMTGDGSPTVKSARFSQHYHSTFGAVTESMHVFIGAGFNRAVEIFQDISAAREEYPVDRPPMGIPIVNEPFGSTLQTPDEAGCQLHADMPSSKPNAISAGTLQILEVGFGTGLNAWLTLLEAESKGIKVHYTAIEAYPLPASVWEKLNYSGTGAGSPYRALFGKLHDWKSPGPVRITDRFTLEKHCCDLNVFTPAGKPYHLVYFDAYDPVAQPELWTSGIFTRIFNSMAERGILVTYSAKGTVKKALRTAGFIIQRLPGPPGKRHMIRAVRPANATAADSFSEV